MITSIIKSPHTHALMVWAAGSFLHWLGGTEPLVINIILLGIVIGIIHTSLMCLIHEFEEMEKMDDYED